MTAKVTPLYGFAPERKLDQITTWDRSTQFANERTPRYSPDDLVGKKGLKVYSRMLDDEQVKAVMNFKRDAVAARGWSFEYDQDSKLSEAERRTRVNVFKRIVESMRGSFQDGLNTIAMGRAYGYSLTEKILSTVKFDGKDWVGINMLVGRDVTDFEFFTEEHGLLVQLKQRINGRLQVVDINNMVHYVHAPEFDRFYGRSDLREAYRSWYIKDVVGKLWPMYLEHFGGGFAVAKRGSDSTIQHGTPEFEALQSALSDIKSNSYVILPPGIELEMHFPANTDAYEKCITHHDLAIAKALLVPNLLGVSHTGQTGAFAQSQTQLEAFFWTLQADAHRLESCIDEQLFKEIGDRNFGDGEYPRFRFKPPSEDHVRWTVSAWRDLVKEQVVMPTEDDEAFVRRLLDMPERGAGAKTITEEHLALNQKYEPEPVPVAPNLVAATRHEVEAMLQARDDRLVLRLESLFNRTPASAPVVLPTATTKAIAFSRALARVHFAVIDRQTDQIAEAAIIELSSLMAKAVVRALGNPERQAELINVDVADVGAFELHGVDVGKLKARSVNALNQGWVIGTELGINELDRAKGTRAERANFTSLRDTAAAYFEANAFRMAGNLSDGARAIIQQELQNAIKYGYSVTATRTHIWEQLLTRGFITAAGLAAVELDEEVLDALAETLAKTVEPAYLNTLIKTNVFEAFNEARFALFTDPEIADFVRALEYSATIDQRTTELCRGLDGHIHRADSPIWDVYRPPNHYNCRSVLIAITAIDGWDGVESMPPVELPQAGFGSAL